MAAGGAEATSYFAALTREAAATSPLPSTPGNAGLRPFSYRYIAEEARHSSEHADVAIGRMMPCRRERDAGAEKQGLCYRRAYFQAHGNGRHA